MVKKAVADLRLNMCCQIFAFELPCIFEMSNLDLTVPTLSLNDDVVN